MILKVSKSTGIVKQVNTAYYTVKFNSFFFILHQNDREIGWFMKGLAPPRF